MQAHQPGLPGPDFLSLLRLFGDEPVAALHSATGDGLSVIARVPLVTLRADAADARLHIDVHHPAWRAAFPSRDLPPLDAWSAYITPGDFAIPPLTGWLGCISYDVARWLEPIGTVAADDTAWPVLHWRLFQEYYLFDPAAQRWTLVTTVPSGVDPQPQLAAMAAHLARHVSPAPPIPPAGLVSRLPQPEYLRRVQRIKDYIAAGDIYQANFAQRWVLQTAAPPVEIFAGLTAASPALYAAYLRFGNRALISASPELLLRRTGPRLITRPIKGTRRRDADAQRDLLLRSELAASAKDRAELAMIVDLLRNDLGRLAQFGSVRVTEPRQIESHPTVWHTVATIEALLAAGALPGTANQTAKQNRDRKGATTAEALSDDPFPNWAAIIRALCPGGSVTGAPKIRAMQILEELEAHRRGAYCGAIGALAGDTGVLNIAIRTIQLLDDRAYIWAGGGIVADSDPEQEYEETLIKARAMMHSLEFSL